MNGIDLSPTAVKDIARVLHGSAAQDGVIFDAIGSARIVLIGEASHGTRAFYRERAEITRRLIAEYGFDFVAVEADWPDAYRTNRFVKEHGDDRDANEALSDFKRFPAWMWRNTEVADFIEWLRSYNRRTSRSKTGFYGLDLYSLYSSIDAVIEYLDRVDPGLAEAARLRYGCFDEFEHEGQAYGYATARAGLEGCEDQVVQQLIDMQRHTAAILASDSPTAGDEAFFAEQNARLVSNAEAYYRAMYRSNVASWNQRDSHMAQTLDALLLHHQRFTPRPRAVVWAHNSHVGDARATEMSSRGELNIGELVKQRYGVDAFAVGFTTYEGSVTAARHWGGPAERRWVRPGLEHSFEALFHHAGAGRFVLMSSLLPDVQRLERAIGVIYQPETERYSHYFDARIASQFEAVIHLDETTALEPLELTDLWRATEPSELPATREESLRA